MAGSDAHNAYAIGWLNLSWYKQQEYVININDQDVFKAIKIERKKIPLRLRLSR